VVRPETMIRWHRAGWKLLWRLKSRPGRPPIPLEIQALIRRIANEHPLWGEERIANEFLLKLIGTIRRECLDWLIPLSEALLRFTLKSWIAHYNGGRPHMALGPGVPDPPVSTLVLPVPNSRHRRDVGPRRLQAFLGRRAVALRSPCIRVRAGALSVKCRHLATR
jgi:hypothetical protein